MNKLEETQMRIFVAMAVISTSIALAGCLEAKSQRVSKPEQTLEQNSCAISCPDYSAYPGIAGSVICGDGSLPLCQCNDSDKAMAGCEPLRVMLDPPLPEMEQPLIDDDGA